MRAIVDQNTCTGCGLCVDTCPEVFEMDGDTAQVKGETIPPKEEPACRQAMEECPVEAISMED